MYFRYINFDQILIKLFAIGCLNTCQIQSYSVPPHVLVIVFLLVVYALLHSCHLAVAGSKLLEKYKLNSE